MVVSPDGSTFKHIYNDNLLRMDKQIGEVRVERASHVEFDNEDQRWRIRVIDKFHNETLLPARFSERESALAFEVRWLEEHCLHE